MGEPLFIRGARSGQLTDAGKLLATYAERILNMREEIKKAIDDCAAAAEANCRSASTKARSMPYYQCSGVTLNSIPTCIWRCGAPFRATSRLKS